MPLTTHCIQIDHPDAPDQVILFSTRTAATVSLTRSALHGIECNGLSREEHELLNELGFIVPSRDTERGEMAAFIDQVNAESRTLRLTVVVNLDCNLACPYCFEGTRKGKYFLSNETAADLVRFAVSQTKGKDEVLITFYGGEPMLSFGMIEHICGRMRDLAEEVGITYGFSLVTNGTLLTRSGVERLKPFGLRSVSVTLDGPRGTHDRSRPFRNGTGSFDVIMGNLQAVSDLVDVSIGGNYTEKNYKEFPKMLDVLMESGLGPERIVSAAFSPVHNEEARFSRFHDGCSNMNKPWVAEAAVFLRREILSRGYRTDEVRPAVCMIERHDLLIVNWDGRLYKCPGLLGRTELCAGSVRTGLADYAETHGLGRWKNEECLACAYLPLCFGGCRYLRLVREGSLRGIDCKKEYFDRALKKLVLQDVRYAHLFPD